MKKIFRDMFNDVFSVSAIRTGICLVCENDRNRLSVVVSDETASEIALAIFAESDPELAEKIKEWRAEI